MIHPSRGLFSSPSQEHPLQRASLQVFILSLEAPTVCNDPSEAPLLRQLGHLDRVPAVVCHVQQV